MSVNSLDLISSPFAVNATTNNLPFVVTSPSASQAQYRLVTDIFIPQRSTSRLVRVKTFPSASLCMLDVAKIAADYLTYDTPMTIANGTGSFTNAAQFKIVMGEEYADSPSGSIVLYNGNGVAGEPAFTASFSGSTSKMGTLIPAVNEYSNLSYDWPEQEWYNDITPNSASTPFLTNDPNFTLSGIINAGGTGSKKVFDYDYETVSVITDGQYNEGFTVILTVNAGLATYTDNNYYTTQTFTAGDLAPLHHIGIGPKNISASNATAAAVIDSGNWTNISLDFEFINGDNRVVELHRDDCSYYDQQLSVNPTSSRDYIKGRTRFAFINKFGVMDYYNVKNPVKKTAKIKRKDYTQPQLPWTTLNNTSGAVFDANKRGKDTYSTSYVNSFEVDTDYLDQELSDWLTELIESPSVYIQNEVLNNILDITSPQYYREREAQESGYAPINIKNASYTWRTNKFKQKVFKYTIQWEFSNIAETRR